MSAIRWTSRDAAIVAPPRRTDVIAIEMDGETMLSDPARESAFHLNATALGVWRRCDGRTTTRAMAADLTRGHDVDFDDALDDVEQVLALLVEHALLETGG